MTRNTLIGGVLAGVLFLGNLGLADDPPKGIQHRLKRTNRRRGGVQTTAYPARRHLFDRRLQPLFWPRLLGVSLLWIL